MITFFKGSLMTGIGIRGAGLIPVPDLPATWQTEHVRMKELTSLFNFVQKKWESTLW